MVKGRINRISILRYIKASVLVLLVIYCGVVTYMFLKVDPRPLVIGVDQNGTRVLGGEDKHFEKLEKKNFVKRFVALLYNFDETSFDAQVSEAGDLMTEELWGAKSEEYVRVSKKSKEEPVTQFAKIIDIREVDSEKLEVDLALNIKSRLNESNVKLRVTISNKQKPRTNRNPFPIEVTNYEETLLN